MLLRSCVSRSAAKLLLWSRGQETIIPKYDATVADENDVDTIQEFHYNCLDNSIEWERQINRSHLYVIISALIVFNVEPDTFGTFFDAIYWACVSLTTVGYGDIYPVTVVGRLVAMISSIFGISIVALPSGIITAGYMDQLKEGIDEKSEQNGQKAWKTGADIQYQSYGRDTIII